MAQHPESSETFPDPPSQGPGAAAPARGSRTMADITRLLLGGAAPATSRRVPPKGNGAGAGNGGGNGGTVKPATKNVVPPAEPVAGPRPKLPVTPPSVALAEEHAAVLPPVQWALTDQMGGQAQSVILQCAKLLASQHQASVGLIGLESGMLRIWRIDPPGQPAFSPTTFAALQGAVDVQLARLLYTQRAQIPHWIIALPQLPADLTRRFLQATPDWLLPAGADNDALITAYRTLKAVCGQHSSESASRHIRLVLPAADRAEAVRVHARLNHVAEGFLHQPLTLLPVAHPATATVHALATFTVGRQETLEAACLSILDFIQDAPETAGAVADEEGTVAEELEQDLAAGAPAILPPIDTPPPPAPAMPALPMVASPPPPLAPAPPPVAASEKPTPKPAASGGVGQDHSRCDATPSFSSLPSPDAGLQNVLDPEEKAALSAEFPAAPPEPPAKPSDVEPTPATPAAPRPSSPEVALRPIDIDAVPTQRAELWKAVQASIIDLIPAATPLEAQPPYDAASCLYADAAGQLHVWYLAEAHDPSAWSALWQWANDHRQLIALTRRDLPISPSAPVSIHIVLPLAVTFAPATFAALTRPAPAHVHWYRTHLLRWHARTGLVVVPLH